MRQIMNKNEVPYEREGQIHNVKIPNRISYTFGMAREAKAYS